MYYSVMFNKSVMNSLIVDIIAASKFDRKDTMDITYAYIKLTNKAFSKRIY